MQALTNLFSRNAAMMNPLEQGFSHKLVPNIVAQYFILIHLK